MKNVKILKRLVSSVPTAQLNKTVFEYYVDNQLIDQTATHTAFIGVLNECMNPDEENYELKGQWDLTPPSVGGATSTPSTFINTYTGTRYIWTVYPPELVTAGQPAQLNGFTGRTFKAEINYMTGGFTYIETTDLYLVTHAEFLDPGYDPEIVDIEVVGGLPRVLPVYNTPTPGYAAITGSQVGTHGIDENGTYRALNFWREEVPGVTVDGEFETVYLDQTTGFSFTNKSIGLKIDESGQPHPSHTPSEICMALSFLSMRFRARNDRAGEADI